MDTFGRQTAARLHELRQSERGKAGDIIGALFDEGTFAELGTFMKRGEGDFEPVITGYGAIDERLVYAFIEDGTREKGAFGEGSAKKICALIDSAQKNKAPVVGVFDSAGAKIDEGVGALGGYGSVIRKLSEAKNVIPRIALINGVCSGAAAIAARMFDIVIAVKDKASIYINPPFLLGGKKTDSSITGTTDIIADDIYDAAVKSRCLLSMLSSCCRQEIPRAETNDDPNRQTPELLEIVSGGKYNVKDAIASIADNGEFTELGEFYATALVTGFIRLNGSAAGVAANNPASDGGALTPAAAAKAAKFVRLCDGLGIPLLTLTDTTGYDCTQVSEDAPYASVLASLSEAYATADCPRVTVVLGHAYGSAFTIMGSKSLGTDIAFALESADISVMPPESAVQLLYGDKIKKSNDPEKTRAGFLSEYKAESSPLAAARDGDIDDIIEYGELRQRIISAFEMLAFKA